MSPPLSLESCGYITGQLGYPRKLPYLKSFIFLHRFPTMCTMAQSKQLARSPTWKALNPNSHSFADMNLSVDLNQALLPSRSASKPPPPNHLNSQFLSFLYLYDLLACRSLRKKHGSDCSKHSRHARQSGGKGFPTGGFGGAGGGNPRNQLFGLGSVILLVGAGVVVNNALFNGKSTLGLSSALPPAR